MSPKIHAIQAAAGTVVLYPFVGPKALIFGLSVVAIDSDHFIEYYLDTGKLSFKGLFEYHNILLNNLDNYLGLNLFHTLECYFILTYAGQYFSDLYFVLYGFLFHHLFDQIQLISLGKPFARAFSIIEYFIRKKHYFTSIHEVLRNKKVPHG